MNISFGYNIMGSISTILMVVFGLFYGEMLLYDKSVPKPIAALLYIIMWFMIVLDKSFIWFNA